MATKSNSKARLLVRNWMEHYCKIPHLAVALQVRSGNQLSRAFCWPAFNRSPRDGQTQLPEGIQLIPTLVFVLLLWRWVGSRLEFAKRWTGTVLSQHKPGTQSAIKSQLRRWLLPVLGSTALKELDGQRLQTFVSKCHCNRRRPETSSRRFA